MNKEWTKENNMDAKLYDMVLEIKTDLAVVKSKLERFDKPPYLQCPLHQHQMSEIDKRLVTAESSLDGIRTTHIKWTGGLLVVACLLLWLLNNIGAPLAVHHLTSSSPVTTNYVEQP